MTSSKWTHLKCYVLSLQDSCVLYPCCQNCASKLQRNQTDQRYRCPKCGFTCEIEKVSYRYKLSLNVARDCDVFGVTLFGSCLNPHFGASAVCLQRFVEESKKTTECPQTDVQRLLVKAVEDCFVGNSFVFGLKISGTDLDGSIYMSDHLSSSLKRRKISGRFIARRMISPNSAVISCPVVTYFKKLLKAAQPAEFSVSQQSGKLLPTQNHDNSTVLNSSECALASLGSSCSQHSSGTSDRRECCQQSLGIIILSAEEHSYPEPDGNAVVDPQKQCTHKEMCNCAIAVLEEDNSSVPLCIDKSLSDCFGEFLYDSYRNSGPLTENNVCNSEKENAKLLNTSCACQLHMKVLSHNDNLSSEDSCDSMKLSNCYSHLGQFNEDTSELYSVDLSSEICHNVLYTVWSNSKENKVSKGCIDNVQSYIQHSSQAQKWKESELSSMIPREAVLKTDDVSHLGYWDISESERRDNIEDYTEELTRMGKRENQQTRYGPSNDFSAQNEQGSCDFIVCDVICKREDKSPQRRISCIDDVHNFSVDLFNGYEGSLIAGKEENKGESCKNSPSVNLNCNSLNSKNVKNNCNHKISEPDLSNSLAFIPLSQSTPISKNLLRPQIKNEHHVSRGHISLRQQLKGNYDDFSKQDVETHLSLRESDLEDVVPPSMHKIPHLSVQKRLMGSIKKNIGGGRCCCRSVLASGEGVYQKSKFEEVHKSSEKTKTEAKSNHSIFFSRSQKGDCSEAKNVKRCVQHFPSNAHTSSPRTEHSSTECDWSADLFTD